MAAATIEAAVVPTAKATMMAAARIMMVRMMVGCTVVGMVVMMVRGIRVARIAKHPKKESTVGGIAAAVIAIFSSMIQGNDHEHDHNHQDGWGREQE
jgi:hypothetical protein